MNAVQHEVEELVKRHSDKDLPAIAGELLKRVFGKVGQTRAVSILDANDKSCGVFLSKEALQNADMDDLPTFLAVLQYRIDNPPDRFLSPDEFIASLEEPVIDAHASK